MVDKFNAALNKALQALAVRERRVRECHDPIASTQAEMQARVELKMPM